MWDAQILPMARAIYNGAKFASVEVSFKASAGMKGEEEGNRAFTSKRLQQLNLVIEKVVAGFKLWKNY